jgi:hypothetical protein
MSDILELTQILTSTGKDVRISYSTNDVGNVYITYVYMDNQFEFDLCDKSEEDIKKIVEAVVYLYNQGVL